MERANIRFVILWLIKFTVSTGVVVQGDKMTSDLTAKERLFVEAYCGNGFNGTKAAIEAGYSERTARSKASQLLTKVNVQDYIQSFMGEATQQALISTVDVVNGLYDIAQHGKNESARVSAYRALADYTGGFDKNKQSVDHSSSDGSMSNRDLTVRIVRPSRD